MLGLSFSLHQLQLFFLPLDIPQDVTIINDKNHRRIFVPSLQTSLYRILYVDYQVEGPLITGHSSWLGSQGSCKVYQSLVTDPPQQACSLLISYFRSLLIRKMDFFYQKQLLKLISPTFYAPLLCTYIQKCKNSSHQTFCTFGIQARKSYE